MQQDVDLHCGLCVHFMFSFKNKKKTKHSFMKILNQSSNLK